MISGEPRRKLLIVSYLFPPAGGITVQRALSFAKYLPRHGWDVHVLKAWDTAAPVRDPGLLAQIPACVTVHEAFTPEIPFALRQKLWSWMKGRRGGKPERDETPSRAAQQPSAGRSALPARLARRIFCPEPEIVWVPFALRKASQIVRKYGIDSLVITAPPFSAFLLGIRLKREFPHLRFIADFRDDWLRFYLSTFDYQNTSYARRRATEIERLTVELADAVVVVTETMLSDIRNRYPGQPAGKFTCVPNGYDTALLQNIRRSPPANGRIVVSHVGTVYSASSARYFLDALENTPEHVRSAFDTRFIGRIADDEKRFFQNRTVPIQQLGFVPQQEALQYMADSDFLLLTMTDAASLTGKIFEYLAVRRPILAVAPDGGEVAQIIRRTSAGWSADPADAGAIREMIIKAYNAKQDASQFRPDPEALRRYDRRVLAEEFGRTIAGNEAKVQIK